MTHAVLEFSPRVTCMPIIHGSGDFALEVRRILLHRKFDCVAVPLPPSFQRDVEAAIDLLPTPTIVVQPEPAAYDSHWTGDELDDSDQDHTLSYVPIDPCQGVIAGLRVALGERMPRAFIDLETARFQPHTDVLPDAYALKTVAPERFAAAVLPVAQRPRVGQRRDRLVHMGARLRELERHHRAILLICSVLDWPWIREAYVEDAPSLAEHENVEDCEVYDVDPATLIFLLGELPFITGLYERARADLEEDENLSIDGVKELLISGRQSYQRERGNRARRVTPQTLACCLKYTRNLTLLERRMTPDLYSIIMACKQTVGDGYALHVAETAGQYPYHHETGHGPVQLGIDRLRLPDGGIARTISRLPGPPLVWRTCQLQKRPDDRDKKKWAMRWNPLAQCSWPPEDELIESFRSHVVDRAKAILGADLARTEKFTTSIKDGIDIRDTLRNWHTGELYVKVLPPCRGHLDAAVMLFDSPADPRDYPWRTTWFAEHKNESTLAFFATDFRQELVGPGIGLATYGGAMFLFPPVSIPDVWTDPRLDFTETLEERILAAACIHSTCPHIALLSTHPPGAGWRRLARRYRKRWIHMPLSGFSDSTVQQLRMVHVLNGRQVRSYAAYFIRKA